MRKRSDVSRKKADRYWKINNRIHKVIAMLSLAVVLCVFWSLKLTGITMAGEAFCGKTEHVHTEACLKGVLICQEEERPAHTHDESCLIKTLICPLEESEAHTHTDACWQTEEGYGCGLEETQGHTHTIDCYEKLEQCPLEEHVHTADCYSNHDADLQTPEDWEASLPELPADATPAQKLILVAESQLGQGESTLNYQVDAEGNRRGITRYGQWYGNPYGDWSAMFASFCLHYAGIEDMPANAGPESMRLEWEEAGLYGSAADFTPEVGYLLFLDKNEDGAADSVALITEAREQALQVIEGDLENAVARTQYTPGAAVILGYGRVPLTQELVFVPQEGTRLIGQTESDSQSLFAEAADLVIYLEDETGFLALDGDGELVQITIAPDGFIYTAMEYPEKLLWQVVDTDEMGNPVIQNLSTGRNLPQPGGDVRLMSETDVAQEPITYQYARAVSHLVWLDGTNGGIMAYNGSPNTLYTVTDGATFQLPQTWQPPAKYHYVLTGWYDVVNNRYYAPGDQVTIQGNTVFYADWVAATYDVGQFNSYVTDTVSTNSFVTTRMFDYSVLMNVLSERATVTVGSSSHSETWNLLTSGNNPYNGEAVTDFILRDWDTANRHISYPNGHNGRNNPTESGTVYSGLYTDKIRDIFFEPSLKLPGKQYLGEGDHLFQICTDPNDVNYGYYYYDSKYNAASYNQSDRRFYVYDYLECTRDSYRDHDGQGSDFLPLNSPYANTNGKTVNTYYYAGAEGEYSGTTHYMYDSKYNTSGNTTGVVGTNYWFGMSVDVDFYLPNDPGTLIDGQYGNRDFFGNQMHFRFAGDDDVWVFVDGVMVLDLGGLHGSEAGDINFSTGEVTINGVRNDTLSNALSGIGDGEHTLTMYYMERGSSLSNCAIYFNLAPRFSFSIQKEDVLTREKLNGAQFSVYTDKECTQPARLWTSKEAHDRGDAATNVFTVVDGAAHMWGLDAGSNYYIKETTAPDDPNYALPNGVIKLTLDYLGKATYTVEVLDTGEGISGGFTVHGFKVDPETQYAYIVATNGPEWIDEVTSIAVQKKWQDSLSHSGDYITVYLTVTDPDGTVRRIREAVLGEENNWTYTWENLPKYYENGEPVIYGVREATVPGYVGKIEVLDGPFEDEGTGGGSASAVGEFENGGTYLLKIKHGYLTAANNQISLETDQAAALADSEALWVATVNGDGTVTLTNQVGQTLYWEDYAFRAKSSPAANMNLGYAENVLSCFVDFGGWSATFYPVDNSGVVDNLTYNHVLYSTNDATQALAVTPEKIGGSEPEPDPDETPEDGNYFRITNIPAGQAVTSLTVNKQWDLQGLGSQELYESLTVQMMLMANGEEAGLTGELNLQNGWQYTFANLPIYDSDSNEIQYTVTEIPIGEEWKPIYGEVVSSGGSNPTYTVQVTNLYSPGGPILPATGSPARLMFVLCGLSIMLGSLVYGFGARRKRERRME